MASAARAVLHPVLEVRLWAHTLRSVVLEPSFKLSNMLAILQLLHMFGGLFLGCIEADSCREMRVLQHFSFFNQISKIL